MFNVFSGLDLGMAIPPTMLLSAQELLKYLP